MRRLFLWLLLLSGLGAKAQNEDSVFIRQIADDVLLKGKAYENLRILCKTVGARLSGSAGMYKAESWGEQTLKAMGADKVYTQECMVPHWVRGGKDEALLTYKNEQGKLTKMSLDILALGNSLGAGKGGINAPVILINNFEELEKQKDNIKGKIVFYNYPFNP